MFKLPTLLFSLFSFTAFAQYGSVDQKLSPKIDPEVLWFQVDSLNTVDTTETSVDWVKYYQLRYDCEQSLYWFDKQKYHLENGLRWSSAHYFHDKSSIEPLIHGLEMCSKLETCGTGDFVSQANDFYQLILSKSSDKDWTADQKMKINNATSNLKLISYDNHQGPVDFDYPISFICCDKDTLVTLHANVEINRNTESYFHYELVAGQKKMLELSVNTNNCRCSDAGFSSKMLVQLSDLNLPESLELDSSNFFWSTVNVWRFQAKNIISFGKLFRNEHGLYIILAYKHNPNDELCLLETHWIAPENLEGL